MKPNLHKPDEKLLYNKVLDQVFLCINDYTPKYSAFMNSQFASRFLEKLRLEHDLNFACYGGIEGAERVKISIAPDYYETEHDDFPISILEIKHNKFKSVSHKDILGSILGLGVDRSKIGDILIYEERSIVFLDLDIVSFVYNNLDYIGRAKVSVSILEGDETYGIYIPLSNYKEMKLSLDSPRISEVIAKAFRLSRSDATKLVSGKKVFVNWELEPKDRHVSLGETITVRGYGRVIVQDIEKDSSITIHIYGN